MNKKIEYSGKARRGNTFNLRLTSSRTSSQAKVDAFQMRLSVVGILKWVHEGVSG